MSSPMNVYNIDGFPSIANALLWGTTLTPLNQSTATVGYVPQVVTGGGLTLTPASGLGITWANTLAAGNTSGANNPTISSPQSIIFAANNIGIGMNGVSNSRSNGDILIGTGSRSGGSTQPMIVIGSGTANAVNTAVSPTIVIGSGTTALSSGGQIVIGNGTASGNGIAIGGASTTAVSGVSIGAAASASGSTDVVIGNSAVTTGGSSSGRVCIGASATAGAPAVTNIIVIGASASGTGQAGVSIGTSATQNNGGTAVGQQASCTGTTNAVAVGGQASCSGASGIAIGSIASATGAQGISLGALTIATQTKSMALGWTAAATHTNSTAVGVNAATTATNQVVLGNNATGGCTQVRSDVGIGGEHVSAGFFRSIALVRAEMNATGAAQTLATGAGETVVQFPAVSYSEDHEAPNIQSVANQLQQRQNYSMTGIAQLELVFDAAGPAAAVEMTVRIKRDIGGVKVSVAKETYTIPIGLLTKSLTLAYTSYVPSGADGFMEVTIDNPSSVNMSIGASSHFVGAYLN